jgi:hypothetical protein
MNNPLDQAYFTWLSDQVGTGSTHPKARHDEFLTQLYMKEFAWNDIPGDNNRLEDGRALRYEFISQAGYERVDARWMGMSCSFLELMMGLSRRLSFLVGREPREWFWHLVYVIGAHPCSDSNYRRAPVQLHNRIDAMMDRIIWRQYHPNGYGGFFPLDHPQEDQRFVEIWYQMNAYLIEHAA